MTDAMPRPFYEAHQRRLLSDMTARADRWMFRCHVAIKLLEDWATAEGPLDPLIERTHTYLEGVKANRAEIDKTVGELHRLRRYRLSMAENNTWQCRKLEKVEALASRWEDTEQAGAIRACAADLQQALNEAEGQPVYGSEVIEAAFTFREPKRFEHKTGETWEAFPGAGFGFVSAGEHQLSLTFDCGGVLACADLTYAQLRAALADAGLAIVARPFSARNGLLPEEIPRVSDIPPLTDHDAKELVEWRAKFSRPDLANATLDRMQRRIDDLTADVTRLRERVRELTCIAVTGRGTNENNMQMGPVQGDGASEPKPD